MIRVLKWFWPGKKPIVSDSVSPIDICPVVTRHDEQLAIVVPSKEDVDPKMALMGKPIVGMENITLEENKSPAAIPARTLPSPKEMSTAQRRIHDLTHLPYYPGCGICVCCAGARTITIEMSRTPRKRFPWLWEIMNFRRPPMRTLR